MGVEAKVLLRQCYRLAFVRHGQWPCARQGHSVCCPGEWVHHKLVKQTEGGYLWLVGARGNSVVQTKGPRCFQAGEFKIQTRTQTMYFLFFLRKFIACELNQSKGIISPESRKAWTPVDSMQKIRDQISWEAGGGD